jgi:predicted AlkP superfamily pyrophosphatase or phosphodiesterase
MLGYRIRDPESKALVNQLTGLSDIVDIGSWLRARPLYGQARSANIHPVVVGHPRFEGSPLTALIHEGADYVGARSLADRAEATFSAVKASRSLVVFYISELDEIAHAKGVESHAWASKLEEVDACLEGLAKGLPKDTALLVTADHGVIDIPAHRHVEFGSDLTIFEGVDNIGGEPRCLQLYVRPEFDSHDIAATWQQHLGDTAIVAVREDVVESGWLGTVDAALVRRMGDVFVFAKKEVVFFDARDPTNKARMMVGHHGGISPVELRIPLLRLR